MAKQGSKVCYRYPSMFVCGCTIPCRIAMKEVKMFPITTKLFVGPIQAAYDVEKLKEEGVTHLIDLSDTDYTTYPLDFTYLHISIEDHAFANLSVHFESTNKFIDGATGKVLVHCRAGVSRSVSICIAYLISTQGFTFEAALTHIQAQNSRAKPNSGFQCQLLEYEKYNSFK